MLEHIRTRNYLKNKLDRGSGDSKWADLTVLKVLHPLKITTRLIFAVFRAVTQMPGHTLTVLCLQIPFHPPNTMIFVSSLPFSQMRQSDISPRGPFQGGGGGGGVFVCFTHSGTF